ncbi:MAG: type II toxin-antitoxin system RelE/ParE family toxin [Kofleriaceae bacterium]
MKLAWSARAERDLIEIADYIALADPAAAARWVDRLRERVHRAAAMPRAGRAVPEARRDDLREVFLQTYRVIYRIEPRRVLVLTVVEGHRPIDDELDA